MNVRDYARPVHRALICRELLFGIPLPGMLLLLILGMFLIMVFEQYVFGTSLIVIMYVIMKMLTKKDAYLVDILLESIDQRDVLIP